MMEREVTLRCKEHAWETRLLDISLMGALLQRPASYTPEPGNTCSVEIMLGPAGPLIAMHGSVVHQEQNHIGFHCEEIDIDSISHLRRLVELNLGNPALLERELSALHYEA